MIPKKTRRSLTNTQAWNQVLLLLDVYTGTRQYYEDDSNGTFQGQSFPLFHSMLIQYFLRPCLEDVLQMTYKL